MGLLNQNGPQGPGGPQQQQQPGGPPQQQQPGQQVPVNGHVQGMLEYLKNRQLYL